MTHRHFAREQFEQAAPYAAVGALGGMFSVPRPVALTWMSPQIVWMECGVGDALECRLRELCPTFYFTSIVLIGVDFPNADKNGATMTRSSASWRLNADSPGYLPRSRLGISLDQYINPGRPGPLSKCLGDLKAHSRPSSCRLNPACPASRQLHHALHPEAALPARSTSWAREGLKLEA